MKQKKTIIILGVAAVFALAVLLWGAAIIYVVERVRGAGEAPTETPVAEALLCSEDPYVLCVVNFSANNLNRMVINLQQPGVEDAPFYIKAKNRDTVTVYACEVDEMDTTIVRCSGARTPLGETIDLEIYATDGDQLLARGTFLVSAIAIPTPLSPPEEDIIDEPYIEGEPTEEPYIEGEPTEEPYIEEPYVEEPTEEPYIEEPTLEPAP